MDLPPLGSLMPPPIGTRAILFWFDRNYGVTFRGADKQSGIWEFAGGDDRFFVVPGSSTIRQYLPAGQSTCVDISNETDSQLGP